jgi:hypothetical protein
MVMRKYLLPVLIVAVSCQDNQDPPSSTPKTSVAASFPATANTTVFTKPPFSFNYDLQKQRCQELYELNKRKRLPGTERKFISFLTDSLLPCWYGTPWDYNGITQVPGEGKIACGYFVTTTLRDAGMKINRVKLAQCIEQNLLWDLCKDFQKFSDRSLEYFVRAIEKTGYGLYIVGLDNHTGYIYNDGKDVWFIHSGVYPPKCTLKEKAINSVTLKNSRYRVFGRIVFDK